MPQVLITTRKPNSIGLAHANHVDQLCYIWSYSKSFNKLIIYPPAFLCLNCIYNSVQIELYLYICVWFSAVELCEGLIKSEFFGMYYSRLDRDFTLSLGNKSHTPSGQINETNMIIFNRRPACTKASQQLEIALLSQEFRVWDRS